MSTSAVQRVLNALEAVGAGPRRNGVGWMARCPAHEDKNASLAVNEGDGGRALLHCHAGCDLAAVLTPLGLTESDLFEPAAVDRRETRETRYAIRDTAGQLVATHVRIDGGPEGKRFFWERDGKPTLGGLRVASLPLYGAERLAAMPPEEPVIVTEGEKACEAVQSRGIHAVATVCGAASCPDRVALAVLASRDVILWPDADHPGRQHMARVAAGLDGIARSVHRFEWRDSPPHGDAFDYFATAGKSSDTLRAELNACTPAGEPPPRRSRTRAEKQGSSLNLSEAEPWPAPVDGLGLFDELAATLRRFVVLPEHAPTTVALWIAMTYLVDVVDVLPRLLLTSPTKACGKSNLLTLIGALAQRSLPASSVTPAAIFRAIEAGQPTLLLDEMDNARLRENDELRALLNSGHTRGNASALRTVGDGHEVRRFSTWAPIAFAAIGKLPDTLASRSIQVQMQRKLASEKVARLRESRVHAEMEPLRQRLARWAGDHASTIDNSEPEPPGALGDRDADNWTPLLAIAASVGGDWPERARRAALALSGVADEDAAGPMLLADIADLFEARGAERLASEDIAGHLGAMETRPWSEWSKGKPIKMAGVARLLRPFGIEPSNVRLPGDDQKKGYQREWFEDAFARYLPPKASQPSQAGIGAAASTLSLPSHAQPGTDAKSGADPHGYCLGTDGTVSGPPLKDWEPVEPSPAYPEDEEQQA